MLRVVVDTNVLVSGIILPRSVPAQLLRRWQNREFELVTCQQALDELDEVLRRPRIAITYLISDEKREAVLSVLKEHVILVPGDRVKDVIAADPDDTVFVSCAVEGGAKYIISGDKHLLALRVTVRHGL